MQEVIWPLTEQGVKHREQFEDHIRIIKDQEHRLVLVEQTLFKSDKIDDRFEWIYNRIAEAESVRANET